MAALDGLDRAPRKGITRFVGCAAIVDASLRGVRIFRGRGSVQGGRVMRAEQRPNEKAQYARCRKARDRYNLSEIRNPILKDARISSVRCCGEMLCRAQSSRVLIIR